MAPTLQFYLNLFRYVGPGRDVLWTCYVSCIPWQWSRNTLTITQQWGFSRKDRRFKCPSGWSSLMTWRNSVSGNEHFLNRPHAMLYGIKGRWESFVKPCSLKWNVVSRYKRKPCWKCDRQARLHSTGWSVSTEHGLGWSSLVLPWSGEGPCVQIT